MHETYAYLYATPINEGCTVKMSNSSLPYCHCIHTFSKKSSISHICNHPNPVKLFNSLGKPLKSNFKIIHENLFKEAYARQRNYFFEFIVLTENEKLVLDLLHSLIVF